jgi:ferrous iron transport protein B
MGLLSAVSYRVTVIWMVSVVGTLLLGGWLASKVVAGERPALFIELPPVRVPRMMNVFKKTMGRVEWYLREAVPLFVVGTLILFSLDRFGMLGWIRAAFAPVVVGFLGLPEAAADALIMGFLRRDYGAAGFFEMFKNGLLTPAQVAVSLVTVTLFVPCLASFLMMVKERGMKSSALMLAIVMPYAMLSGGAVRFVIDAIGLRF